MTTHISNGVDVDPNWTELIAVSNDGVTWSTFRKDAIINIAQVSSSNANKGTFGSPQRDQNRRIHINLRGGLDITFDVQDVANQATWSNGTLAALQVAVSDINSWL